MYLHSNEIHNSFASREYFFKCYDSVTLEKNLQLQKFSMH